MKKKKKSFPKKSALLLTASALLLIGSTVGSTRAALTYYSENYSAQIEMQNIGVSLLENGDVVSSQDFTSKNQQEVKDGELLTGLLGEKEKFAPGKKYKEELSVQNSGNIDTFVRVILTKSWQDKEGNKRRSAEVVADNVYFGDSKRDAAGDNGGYSPAPSYGYSAPAAPAADHRRKNRSLLHKGSKSRRYHTGII